MMVENTFGRYVRQVCQVYEACKHGYVIPVIPVTKASCILHNLCEMQQNHFLPEWENANLHSDEPVWRDNKIVHDCRGWWHSCSIDRIFYSNIAQDLLCKLCSYFMVAIHSLIKSVLNFNYIVRKRNVHYCFMSTKTRLLQSHMVCYDTVKVENWLDDRHWVSLIFTTNNA